jgi:hypothetical protein
MTCLDVPVDTAVLCELGERAYAFWWLAGVAETAECIRIWWPS